MRAVFDTNILIDYLNGANPAAEELRRYHTRMISIITYVEVLVGVRGTSSEPAVRRFLSSFRNQSLTSSVAEQAVDLRKELGLKLPDALIYATARAEGCLFVSRNTKDFPEEWPDVRVPYRL